MKNNLNDAFQAYCELLDNIDQVDLEKIVAEIDMGKPFQHTANFSEELQAIMNLKVDKPTLQID